MEASDLTHARFWHSAENFVAAAPGRERDADGLLSFSVTELGARGWCFFQTSGSEAEPRWVGLEKNAFLISAEAVNRHFAVARPDRWLMALPLHHVGGFSILARGLVSGSSISRMIGKWDVHEFARRCRVEGVTLTSLVPAQVWDIVAAGLASPESIRAVIVGGGALSMELRHQAIALGWPVCATYGMTETASQVAAQSPDAPDAGPPDAMEVLPHWTVHTEESGLLTVRGPALAKGYAVRDAAGSWQWHPIDPIHGLRTRDRVDLRQDGNRRILRFLGRDASFVKILGELVNIEQLQNRIDELTNALQIRSRLVIVPLPDARKEFRLALVTEAGTLSTGQLRQVLDSFHEDCRPFERVDETREVARIPLSALGKIEHARLAAELGQASP